MLSKIFGEKLCDALCYSDILYCDPYKVTPGTKVFIVIHMPKVLDPKLAPYNNYRVAFVPATEFASTTIGETAEDPHFVLNTVVVESTPIENVHTIPVKNIYGECNASYGYSVGNICCMAEATAEVTEHMWRKDEVKKWRDAFEVVDIVGVVLYASLVDKRNEYFLGLIKEKMTLSLWDAHTGGTCKRHKRNVE